MCSFQTFHTVRMGWAQAKVCSVIPKVFSEASPLCALKLGYLTTHLRQSDYEAQNRLKLSCMWSPVVLKSVKI